MILIDAATIYPDRFILTTLIGCVFLLWSRGSLIGIGGSRDRLWRGWGCRCCWGLGWKREIILCPGLVIMICSCSSPIGCYGVWCYWWCQLILITLCSYCHQFQTDNLILITTIDYLNWSSTSPQTALHLPSGTLLISIASHYTVYSSANV